MAAAIELIFFCIIVGLPIFFLILLILLRKLKYRWIPGIILVFFVLTSGYAIHYFILDHEYKIECTKKYLGFYKLDRLDCEDCKDCKVDLLPDYKYEILQNNKVVGKGEWDLDYDPESGYFLKIENGPGGIIHETPREIEYIDRKNCNDEGCKENLREEFTGKIVDIKLDGYHWDQKTIFIRVSSGDTFKYYPKYFPHPWLEKKVQIGDYLSKRKNTMNFTVVHKKDTTFLNYEMPDCGK